MKTRSVVLLMIVLGSIFALTWIVAPHSASASDSNSKFISKTEYAPDVVLLGLKPGASIQGTSTSNQRIYSTDSFALSADLALLNVRAAEPVFSFAVHSNKPEIRGLQSIYRLHLPASSDVLLAIAKLKADPDVLFVEPDYIAHAADVQRLAARLSTVATIPNDPLYPSQWGLTQINAATAWNVVTGTPSVVIAIIDSGIDTTHPDLSAQLWINPGEITGNGIDDDNNGYIDDVNGWNFVNNSNDVSDDNGHGTQVAGIATASTNNGTGISGMCWRCRLMAVKVMNNVGVANYSDIAVGVAYAAAKGAQVINLSIGGYADSSALRAAIAAASTNTVIVGGAGNDNVSTPFYPAAYPNVVAVAAATITDTKASFSNYGAWITVAAPGVAITTTFSGGGYGVDSGTSLAAPFASGLAGLLRSLHSNWSPTLIRSQIIHTADSLTGSDPVYGAQLGAGRINAGNAMQSPHPLFSISGYSVNGTPKARPNPSSGNALVVSIYNDWFDATNVNGTLSSSDPFVTIVTNTASFGSIASGATANSSNFSFTVASGAGYNHIITFTLNLSSNGGAYTATLPLQVTTASGNVNVGGTIASDTIWTNDKTYIVTTNIGIAPGVTLTIQRGTVVKFDGSYSLNIGGTLIAGGTGTQPIVFQSNVGGAWGQIAFADSSVDAQADSDGNYLSGNILRYVTIQSSSGIACSTATPYLSHVALSGGGMNCTLGATALWLSDSSLTGLINVIGNARVQRNTITGGNMNIGSGLVTSNTITNGNLSLTSFSGGSETIVANNIVNNGGLSMIYGGSVLSNTFRGGNGLCVGGASAEVSGNDVQDSTGGIVAGVVITTPILCAPIFPVTGTIRALHNRIIGTTGNSGLQARGLVQDNLIANNTGGGLVLNGNATVLSNTFTGNQGNTILLQSGTTFTIEDNNLEGNAGPYDFYVNIANGPTISARFNWWGITDTTAIDNRIFDFNDDFSKAVVVYPPMLTAPHQDAPAYLRRVAVLPDTTLGIQTGTFETKFSRPMDTSSNPVLAFGPYTVTDNSQWLSPTQYRASYDVNALIAKSTYSITVVGAVGLDGIVIAPNSNYTFTVDYAGGVVDTTPPPAPSLSVNICLNSTTSVVAKWAGYDPNSSITLYRYALGSTPRGIDVINWTSTLSTSITRTALSLITRQKYYFSVQARNAGGLWSPATSAGFTAGVPCQKIYLPLVLKNH